MALALCVQHDVIAEQLEGSGQRRHGDGAAEEGLDDDFLHLRPDAAEGITHPVDLFLQTLQGNLGATYEVLLGFQVILIDREVGQMHE